MPKMIAFSYKILTDWLFGKISGESASIQKSVGS